ncbi:cysteine synthase family protein [bacterium]|nr:cysteine synthase family protein [bacterium]
MTFVNLLDTIGQTPLVHAPRLSAELGCEIGFKLEYLNPGLSIKDRMVKHIIQQGVREGKIGPDTTIVEGSSGNTAASVAMIAAAMGLRARIVMPEKVSREKVDTVRAYGAEVIMTTTESDPNSPNYYPNVAKRIVESTPNCFYVDQYMNPANTDAHYAITGPELYSQCGGQIDLLVIGVGTGGSATGIGRYFKERDQLKVLGIDTVGSIYTEHFYTGSHGEAAIYKVEGIGEDFIPPIVDFQYIDDFEQVSDKDSFLAGRELARTDGLLLGGSTGSAVAGLKQYLAKKGGAAAAGFKRVVVLSPDSGVKYLSKMYNDDWMREQGWL